jgi:hypothetical protein
MMNDHLFNIIDELKIKMYVIPEKTLNLIKTTLIRKGYYQVIIFFSFVPFFAFFLAIAVLYF